MDQHVCLFSDFRLRRRVPEKQLALRCFVTACRRACKELLRADARCRHARARAARAPSDAVRRCACAPHRQFCLAAVVVIRGLPQCYFVMPGVNAHHAVCHSCAPCRTCRHRHATTAIYASVYYSFDFTTRCQHFLPTTDDHY